VAVLCSGIFLDLVFWILAAALGISAQSALGIALEVLGLLGPMLGGIGFTYFTQDNESWREYWSRIVDPKRIPAKWYLVIFLFVPVLMAIAVLLDVVLGGGAVLAQIGKRVTPFLSAPLTIIPFAVHLFIYGPFPEELGWRGYVLDRLQARWNALVSSLMVRSGHYGICRCFISKTLTPTTVRVLGRRGSGCSWWKSFLRLSYTHGFSTTLAAARLRQSFFIS
jgi:membrane protease YdiL (CAAX protease family)